MPMYDSLADQIKYFLLNGGDYHVAPNLGSDVLDRIDAFVARFLGYPEHYRHTQVLWMAHCWAMDCWIRTPRLLFVSPEPNCGKTTALEIIQRFVPRAGEELVSNLTEAALYQAIEDAVKEKGGRPTILHDQLDKLFGNREYGRIRSGKVENIIETGFQRSGTIKRKMKGRSMPFNVYAPMALAGTMDLSYVPDAILSRSLIIHMQRALPGEVPERWHERRHSAEAESLCWLLRYWVEFIHDSIREHQPAIPESLTNRDIDKWEPLLRDGRSGGRAVAGTGACHRCHRCHRFRGERAERGHAAAVGNPGDLRPPQRRPHLQRRTGGRVGQNRRIRLVKMACSARRNQDGEHPQGVRNPSQFLP